MIERSNLPVQVAGLLLVGIALAVGFGHVGAYAAIPAAALWWFAGHQELRAGPRGQLTWMFGVALALHVGVASSGFQSNDLHRYLWEGTVQLHGFSPYATAPDAAVLTPLRDARFNLVAFPELPSIYPPLAQLTFLSAAAAGWTETGYRNGIILASLALTGLIALWLRATGRPVDRVLFYAWSPVAVLAAVGGHIDVLMAAALVGFVWAWESGRFRLAGAMLGVGVLAKTMALLLIPWALWRRPRVILAITVPIVALGYAPYLKAGNVLGSLLTFAGDFRFNATAYEALLPLLGSATGLFAATLLGFWVVWCMLRVESPADMVVRVLGGLLLLAPVVHYWYATWLLAVLPGVRSARLRVFVLAWVASLAALVPLYLAIANGTPQPSAMPLIAIELGLPLVALAAYTLREAASRKSHGEDSPCATIASSLP